MPIAFTFTIISVDAPAKTMRIRYESEGRQTIDVTSRLPSEEQTLVDVVAARAPVYAWEEQERQVANIVPGTAGSGVTAPTVLITPGIAFSQFYGLFTNTEKNALIGATQTDAQTKRRYDELRMLSLISTALPEVELLLSQLVSLGVITGARKNEIIAAMPA